MRNFKRAFAAMLAVVCLTVFATSSVFAATASPKVGDYKQTQSTGTYRITSVEKKTVAKKKPKSKNAKVDTIVSTVSIQGKTYKVTKLATNTYKGCTKLKKINIKSKKLVKINKTAFRGLKKSQVKKIKVVVTKKMSKKTFKKMKKLLIKAGISKKNIKRSSKF